ncbi:unnamed protein product, partial [Mesorhabditis spiculigera]
MKKKQHKEHSKSSKKHRSKEKKRHRSRSTSTSRSSTYSPVPRKSERRKHRKRKRQIIHRKKDTKKHKKKTKHRAGDGEPRSRSKPKEETPIPEDKGYDTDASFDKYVDDGRILVKKAFALLPSSIYEPLVPVELKGYGKSEILTLAMKAIQEIPQSDLASMLKAGEQTAGKIFNSTRPARTNEAPPQAAGRPVDEVELPVDLDMEPGELAD